MTTPIGNLSGSVISHIGIYFSQIANLAQRMPQDQVQAALQALYNTYRRGGRVFAMGNGGSASTAVHLATDFSKSTIIPGRPRMKVICLGDNIGLMTAWANDTSYDQVFAQQLENLVEPGDLVLAISTSGNSPNVLRAVEFARQAGVQTIGFCGYAGGRLAGLVDIPVIAPGDRVTQIEDAHHILVHLLTECLTQAIREESG